MNKQLKTPQLQLVFDRKTNTFLQCGEQSTMYLSTVSHYKLFDYSNFYSYECNPNTLLQQETPKV